jgi:hypothetical protein
VGGDGNILSASLMLGILEDLELRTENFPPLSESLRLKSITNSFSLVLSQPPRYQQFPVIFTVGNFYPPRSFPSPSFTLTATTKFLAPALFGHENVTGNIKLWV